MAIEKVRDFFGVKFAIPYDTLTFKPFGIWRVIQEFNMERSVEFNDLLGGDIQGAWDSEAGQPENNLTGTLREYPFFSFEVMEDSITTETAGEALGSIGTIANKSGTSVFDATTGIASVAAKGGEEANIKGIRYVFVATGPATVDIYVHGSADFLDIDGVVAQGVIVPSTGGTVDVDVLGITITGGSGTVAFVTDDSAFLDTRPIHSGFGVTPVGSQFAKANEFGMITVFPPKSDGAQFWIDIHKIKALGMPWQAVTREWSEWTFTGKPIIDTSVDALYTLFTKKSDV